MAGLLGKLLGVAVAAGSVYAVTKYMKKYTDFKVVEDEDVENIRENTGKVKEAAKRTYVAVKERQDVKEAATDLKNAAVDTIKDAGKIVSHTGSNTIQFAKEEKAKYNEDPEAYKAQVNESFADMKESAKKSFETFRSDAGDILNDIKNTAAGMKEDAAEFVKGFTAKPACESCSMEDAVEAEFTDVTAEPTEEEVKEASEELEEACEKLEAEEEEIAAAEPEEADPFCGEKENEETVEIPEPTLDITEEKAPENI